ncbi:hypothetical protein VNO77_34273 [Canavalia gladiata]|uniref:Uncharacterized protein n=1 Tax=Canavalia gladiata TaxID=3824 RepID=A0AAN9KDZ0_CANGL
MKIGCLGVLIHYDYAVVLTQINDHVKETKLAERENPPLNSSLKLKYRLAPCFNYNSTLEFNLARIIEEMEFREAERGRGSRNRAPEQWLAFAQRAHTPHPNRTIQRRPGCISDHWAV